MQPGALSYGCGACGGRGLTLAVLRRLVHPDEIRQLWTATLRGTPRSVRCPICRTRMVAAGGADDVELDVCRGCQFVWLDPGELEALPPPPVVDRSVPPALEQQLALMEASLQAQFREETVFSAERIGPAEWWKWVPALIGMPVEESSGGTGRRPWLTWGLAAVIVAVYLATLADHAAVIARWGLLPAEPWRAVGLTFLSSALLHADVWHLVGNLYFLLVFGDDVEEVLGRPRYALLLLCAALAGGAAHVAFDPRADVPCIGASAAISGVLVAYASWFPRARLALLFFFFVSFRWLRCQAWFALVLWIVLQLVGAVMQAGGLSAVSAVAHLGGAGVGLLAWLAARGGRVDARRGAGAPRAA